MKNTSRQGGGREGRYRVGEGTAKPPAVACREWPPLPGAQQLWSRPGAPASGVGSSPFFVNSFWMKLKLKWNQKCSSQAQWYKSKHESGKMTRNSVDNSINHHHNSPWCGLQELLFFILLRRKTAVFSLRNFVTSSRVVLEGQAVLEKPSLWLVETLQRTFCEWPKIKRKKKKRTFLTAKMAFDRCWRLL